MEPERIGRYEIKSEIGRGGMATVYRAYDPRFKREVAIKVLPNQFLHDPTFRARFEREAMMIAAIEHPNIVPVYDYGEENGQPYLVMRYMQGGSLSDVLKKGPLSFRETANIITQLAPAMDEMHSRGIIHRDLKPGNILFDHYGNAFISDFGIARLTEATTTLTGDAIIGTPSYMSPEQARGETDIDGRSDVYALGAILFEMLTGKQPYQATTPMGIVMKHLTEPVPRILDVKADLPPGTENVITRAMAKKRDDRFQTARDLATAQQAVIKQQSAQHMALTQVEKIDLPPTTEKSPAGVAQNVPQAKATAEKTPIEKQTEGKPAVVATPPVSEGKSPAAAIEQSPPVSHTPEAAAPASTSGQSQKPAEAQVFPQPARPAAAARPRAKPRPWIWVAGAVVVIAGLCLLASALGIPKLLNALAPDSATSTVELVSPSPPPLDATEEPAAPPTSSSQTVDVFVDGFDNPDSGWDRQESEGSITDYEAGFYKIYVDRPTTFYWANPGLNFSDVSLEVEATKTSGPDDNFFGLICRYQDPYNFYMLAISSDGYYSIRKYQEGVFYFLGNDNWEFSSVIHQGKTTNILRADCIGDILKLYGNGTLLAEAQDKSFTSGDVGLTAAALDIPGTNILFDNFVAAKP